MTKKTKQQSCWCSTLTISAIIIVVITTAVAGLITYLMIFHHTVAVNSLMNNSSKPLVSTDPLEYNRTWHQANNTLIVGGQHGGRTACSECHTVCSKSSEQDRSRSARVCLTPDRVEKVCCDAEKPTITRPRIEVRHPEIGEESKTELVTKKPDPLIRARISERHCGIRAYAAPQEKPKTNQKSSSHLATIVNGVPSEEGSWPWAALIGLREHEVSGDSGLSNESSDRTDKWICGGSLISNWFVLTAAHCIARFGQEPQRLVVLLGTVSISTSSSHGRTKSVSRIYVHDKYNYYVHDIALLKFSEEIIYSRYILPICLPPSLPQTPSADGNNTSQYDTYLARPVRIIGWGKTTYPSESVSEQLREANITVTSTAQCLLHYRHRIAGFQHIFPGDSFLRLVVCAAEGKKDTCHGDSGGPLMMEQPVGSGQFQIIGITNTGIGCGTGFPGISTRVDQYIDWISSITVLR